MRWGIASKLVAVVVPRTAHGQIANRLEDSYTRYESAEAAAFQVSRTTSGSTRLTCRFPGANTGHTVENDHGLGTTPGPRLFPFVSLPETVTV